MSKFSYRNKPLGLYLHIPFCVKKCGYCDFYSVEDRELMKEYVSALLLHIRSYGKVCSGYTVDTVYIGGGTPTCLGPKYLGRILQEIRNKFPLAEDAEITVECNPESTDKKVLDVMKKQGVNRLSFGVQSAHDEELRAIGRIHTFAQAKEAVELAREKGFANISLDLMYGLPGQTREMFLDSVEQCLGLEPQHLSCYGLKLEPGTPMGRENPVLPDDDAQADTYLAMCERLRDKGYEHYEISNFAKPGCRSRHNMKYWDLSEYLGLGPGAHSFMNGRRFAFARDLKAYIGGEDIVQDEDEVPTFQRQGEYLMVRLRTADGVDFLDLEKRYNIDSTPYEEAFRGLMGNGLVAHQGTRWYLTEKGFLVSNSIINIVVAAGQEQMTS
ncbi:radical SAM family heme chaperone HemW [Agathobaculum desmolans]|uniref:radical SAM family heme chaperone HemW n=1 Tax=Agathobaculum desmolans TaxID=39484 RepID=UPI00248D8673|nr:radical SAM family heme chaperone HemW [Agathobaculum desmolans]